MDSKKYAYRSFIPEVVGEVVLEQISVGSEHLHNSLGKPLHVPVPAHRT
jgi:hypothetical protein